MQYGIKLLYLGVQMNRHGINGSGCIADFSGARIFSLLPSFPESISLIYSTHVYKNFRIEHFIRNFVQLWWYYAQWIFFSSIWRRKSSRSTAYNVRTDNSFPYRCRDERDWLLFSNLAIFLLERLELLE